MNPSPTWRAALGASLLLLAGCGGLLGGGGNADLYRFGSTPVPPTETPPGNAPPLLVLFPGANFDRAIESDRILTVNGSQAGYVADARWVSPASDLFDAAARRAFQQRTPVAYVVRLRGSPLPDYALGIDVRRFEADYVGGMEAPPEIVLEAVVRLMSWSERTMVAEWPIEIREPAQDNRLPSIVQAFDRATGQAVTRIADLAQQTLASRPRLAQRPMP